MKRKSFLLILLIILTIILLIPAMAFAASVGDVPDGGSFFTWEILITYGGCLLATIAATQFFKRLWPKKWATQFLSYALAVIILILANLFLGTLTAQSVVISFINAIGIAFAANGGYSNSKEIAAAVTSKKTPSE